MKITKPLALSEAAPALQNQKLTFAVPATFGIDPTAPGVLLGLQLLSAGREAKGWGIYIDERTLETGLEVSAAAGGKLKGYVTHSHGGPGTYYWGQDRSELDVAGFFSGIAIAKSQLSAGRFEFFESFRAESKKEFDRLMEMAAKAPELIGLSIEAWGYAVYVDTAGVEYSQRPEDIELANEGLPTLRITDLFAAAFVSDGAATTGLYTALSRGKSKAGKALKALLATLNLGGADDTDETPAGSPANTPEATPPQPLVTPHTLSKAPVNSPTSTMKLITELKTKFGATPARLTAAMGILGASANPDTLTLAEVEVQLSAIDLSAAQKSVTDLTTERDTLKTTLGTVETERDTLKAQLQTLKNSGVGGIDLGAGSGSPAGGEANPWMKATLNVSEQCKIQKSDPARAATLKAIAGAK